MEAIDVSGKTVKAGDIVVFGHNNGSTLVLGRVTKVTPKKVWMIVDDFVQCRDWSRVCKVETNE